MLVYNQADGSTKAFSNFVCNPIKSKQYKMQIYHVILFALSISKLFTTTFFIEKKTTSVWWICQNLISKKKNSCIKYESFHKFSKQKKSEVRFKLPLKNAEFFT